MINLLGAYVNGNYHVLLFDDGTKIRINNKLTLEPETFESADIKITNMCKNGCPYCHENSTADGKHADFKKFEKLFDSMHPFTELAIGGGNPLEHPELERFLTDLTDRSIVPSMTVRYNDFIDKQEFLKALSVENKVYGLGISMPDTPEMWCEYLLDSIGEFPNAVMHVIFGVTPVEALKRAENRGLKLLVLGYKYIRRGADYSDVNAGLIDKNKTDFLRYLPSIVYNKTFKIVSFDNKGINQTNIRSYFQNAETWNRMYMGDDGEYTMFIDLVEEEFALSSSSFRRYKLLPEYSAQDIFDIVRNRKKGIISSL